MLLLFQLTFIAFPLNYIPQVRISQNWVRGHYAEMQLIVQDIRYMPRIQLDAETIWVSWGAQVWAHPRRSDGTVCRTASQVIQNRGVGA